MKSELKQRDRAMIASLQELLDDYARVRRILDEADERNPDQRSRPLPPATTEDIVAFEVKRGLTLPPSYRRFLELHNGWARFWGAMWIAGVGGEAEVYVRGQIAEWRKYMSAPAGPDDLDFDRHLIIGADDNGGFLALDLTARADGERDLLDMPRGFVENRWTSFGEFVEDQHRYRSRDAAKRKKKAPDRNKG